MAIDVASSLTGFTRLSKGLATVFAVGFVITQLLPWTVDYLALVPGKTIPFAWNIVTAGYLQQSLVALIFSVGSVLYFGKTFEPVWGSREFLKFVAFVSFFTSVSTFVLSIFLYYITGQGSYLYSPISGFDGVLSGFLVAVKQLMPEQELIPLFKLRAKWIPSIFVVFTAILGLVSNDQMKIVPFVTFGAYVSWVYLRYFQRMSETSVKGDSSDDFAFTTFFPPFMRPLILPITVFCEKLLCKGRLKSSDDVDEEQGYVVGGRPLPGSDPIDASRRRERGARALEERLTSSSASSNVTVDDNITSTTEDSA